MLLLCCVHTYVCTNIILNRLSTVNTLNISLQHHSIPLCLSLPPATHSRHHIKNKNAFIRCYFNHTSNSWTTTTQYNIYIIIEWKQSKKKQTNYVFKMFYVQRAAAKISRHRRLFGGRKGMSGVWCNGAFEKGMLRKVGAQTSHWLMDSKQNHINIFNEIYIEVMYL